MGPASPAAAEKYSIDSLFQRRLIGLPGQNSSGRAVVADKLAWVLGATLALQRLWTSQNPVSLR
jgi:hypothetical protein